MNIGCCRVCKCGAFAPQYWRDHKCRDCFHTVMDHSPAFEPEPEPAPVVETGKAGETLSHRDRVAREILTTERTYVENMNTLIEVFLLPLKQSGDISSPNITAIFANIEEIVHINRELLSSLESRIGTNWSPTQRIGDAMLTLTPFLKMYTKYTANYDNALATITECEKNSAFRAFMQKCHEVPQCKALNLRSFLIQPVQRIPRYNMLLEDLIKHTDKTHVDYESLCSALKTMREVANDINEAIRISENRIKVLAIQKALLTEIELIAPSRMFVREGVLTKVCRKSHKRYVFFLFTDILLYCAALANGRYVFHRMIQLEACRLEDIPDEEKVSNAFRIIGSQKSFVVFAENVRQKVDWLLDLTDIINKLKERRMTLRRGQSLFDDIISEAPVWTPDKAASYCTVCQTNFHILRRRHHCRACGVLVCKACSHQKLLLPTIDAKRKVRVCDDCHTTLSQQDELLRGQRMSMDQQPQQSQLQLQPQSQPQSQPQPQPPQQQPKPQQIQQPTQQAPQQPKPQQPTQQTQQGGEQSPPTPQYKRHLDLKQQSAPQLTSPSSAPSSPQQSPKSTPNSRTTSPPVSKATPPPIAPRSAAPPTTATTTTTATATTTTATTTTAASPTTPRSTPPAASTPPSNRPPVPPREPSKIKV